MSGLPMIYIAPTIDIKARDKEHPVHCDVELVDLTDVYARFKLYIDTTEKMTARTILAGQVEPFIGVVDGLTTKTYLGMSNKRYTVVYIEVRGTMRQVMAARDQIVAKTTVWVNQL